MCVCREMNISTRDIVMVLLHLNQCLPPPNDVEIFIFIEQKAKIGTTILVGMIDSDYLEELESLLHNGGRRKDV